MLTVGDESLKMQPIVALPQMRRAPNGRIWQGLATLDADAAGVVRVFGGGAIGQPQQQAKPASDLPCLSALSPEMAVTKYCVLARQSQCNAWQRFLPSPDAALVHVRAAYYLSLSLSCRAVVWLLLLLDAIVY